MTTWTQLAKNTATWTGQVKEAISGYLLKQDTEFLLLESGDKIILEGAGWSNQTKNTTTWSNQAKT